jgi:hypothetical protein
MVAGRSSSTAQESGSGKPVKVVVGGKLHRRGGRPISHMNCNKHAGLRTQVQCYLSQCLERGKLVAEAHRKTE